MHRLPPPLFKLFEDKLIHYLTDIFNAVFDSGKFPQCWARRCIKVIHKRGSRSDPNNYRGITLLPIMGKLFTTNLNDELLEWVEDN